MDYNHIHRCNFSSICYDTNTIVFTRIIDGSGIYNMW